MILLLVSFGAVNGICPPNEIMAKCGNWDCMKLCEDNIINTTCIQHCEPPGCVCTYGFQRCRMTGVCTPNSECVNVAHPFGNTVPSITTVDPPGSSQMTVNPLCSSSTTIDPPFDVPNTRISNVTKMFPTTPSITSHRLTSPTIGTGSKSTTKNPLKPMNSTQSDPRLPIPKFPSPSNKTSTESSSDVNSLSSSAPSHLPKNPTTPDLPVSSSNSSQNTTEVQTIKQFGLTIHRFFLSSRIVHYFTLGNDKPVGYTEEPGDGSVLSTGLFTQNFSALCPDLVERQWYTGKNPYGSTITFIGENPPSGFTLQGNFYCSPQMGYCGSNFQLVRIDKTGLDASYLYPLTLEAQMIVSGKIPTVYENQIAEVICYTWN